MSALCLRCHRLTATKSGRFGLHSLTPKSGIRCPMSWQLIPVEGVSDSDYERRAVLVGELAQQVQDYSPHDVWEYLTALPGAELQRLLMVSLAAIPLDRSLNDMYRWVVDLPIAQGVAV